MIFVSGLNSVRPDFLILETKVSLKRNNSCNNKRKMILLFQEVQ